MIPKTLGVNCEHSIDNDEIMLLQSEPEEPDGCTVRFFFHAALLIDFSFARMQKSSRISEWWWCTCVGLCSIVFVSNGNEKTKRLAIKDTKEPTAV